MTDVADHEAQEAPRKGKSNAILTYQLMSAFDRKLTELVTRFEDFMSQREEAKGDHDDHEARLRSLETTITGLVAAKAQSTGQWQWVWAAVIAIFDITLHIAAISAVLYTHSTH